MTDNQTHYQCPKCETDMTDQVYAHCKPSIVVRISAGRGSRRGAEAPTSVTLECPNGHWAEYPCPVDARARS
jgi:hypothetical protein